MKSASLCHSDLMLFEPNDLNMTFGIAKPFTMGHEACGTIISLGSSVTGFQPGDNIGWLCIINCCFECEPCQIHNLYCEKGTSTVQGFASDGYFQEYVAIDHRNAAKLPPGMPMENLAPIFCAGVTSYHSVMDTLSDLPNSPPPSTWIAIIGCGGLGHLGIQYLHALHYRIIAIDLSPTALTEALSSGADHTFNPSTDPTYVSKIRALTDGKGVHAAINYTNSVPAYTSMTDLLRYNGVYMVTGIPQKPLQLSAMEISMKRIRVRGSNNGTTKGLRECLEFSHRHGIMPHMTRFALEEVPEMVRMMEKAEHKGKMGVVFD